MVTHYLMPFNDRSVFMLFLLTDKKCCLYVLSEPNESVQISKRRLFSSYHTFFADIDHLSTYSDIL